MSVLVLLFTKINQKANWWENPVVSRGQEGERGGGPPPRPRSSRCLGKVTKPRRGPQAQGLFGCQTASAECKSMRSQGWTSHGLISQRRTDEIPKLTVHARMPGDFPHPSKLSILQNSHLLYLCRTAGWHCGLSYCMTTSVPLTGGSVWILVSNLGPC